MLDSCEKSFDSLSENSIVQRQDLLRLEMNNFWNELFMKDEKQELYSSWSPSDNCCSVGQYDTESTLNQADDFAFCIMGHHKILSPLLKDSFLTTPFLEARKRSEASVENEEKGDDTKNRENLLEEMASADLTTYCVDPNEIFYNGQLKKLGSAAVESRNSFVVSDFSSVISSSNLSYEEMWSDSDSDELQSSSQPSGELNCNTAVARFHIIPWMFGYFINVGYDLIWTYISRRLGSTL